MTAITPALIERDHVIYWFPQVTRTTTETFPNRWDALASHIQTIGWHLGSPAAALRGLRRLLGRGA
jgi:hypothetical protein